LLPFHLNTKKHCTQAFVDIVEYIVAFCIVVHDHFKLFYKSIVLISTGIEEMRQKRDSLPFLEISFVHLNINDT
jgi:hypothetical protein